MKYLGTFKGQQMYGDSVAEDCLLWHTTQLESLRHTKLALEMKVWEFENKSKGFWARFFNLH